MWKRKKRYPRSYADHFRPADTVPVTHRRLRPNLIAGLLKIGFLAGIILYAAFYMPVPALLWTYQYVGGTNGSARYHTACTYITAKGEYHRTLPPRGADRCRALILISRA